MLDLEVQLALDEKQDEILTGMPVPQDGKIGDIRTNVAHKGKFYQTMKTGINTHFFSAPFSRVPSIHTMDDYLLKSGGKMLKGSLIDAYDVTVRSGLTLSGLSPGDAVLVLDGTGKVVTDENLTWDGSVLSITGLQDIMHTATEAEDHALEIDCNAAGFGDVKAIDIDYITGAIAAGQDEGIILINIDESLATGGDVFALEVLATEGSAGIYGLKAGALVGPIHQDSGTFANMDSALVNAVDRRAEFISSASDIAIFVADNDTVTIGDAATFEEIEFLLATTASVSIKPTFEFSTGVGAWTAFTPVDGTNGMRNTGVIAWDVADIPTWAVGAGAEYLIRITRTRNNLTTTPVEDKVQIAATTTYEWDKSGDLSIRAAALAGALTLNSVSAGTDNTVLILDGAVVKSDEIDSRVWGATLVGTATANYVTLTDNSMADTLHRHSELSASDGTPDAVVSVDSDGILYADAGPTGIDILYSATIGAHLTVGNDLTVSGTIINTDFTTLTDNSMADALHRHSELSASDGNPDAALTLDGAGIVSITTNQLRFSEARGLVYDAAVNDLGIVLDGTMLIANSLVYFDNAGYVGIGVAPLAGAILTLEGSIKMKEQAAAGADTAAYGQLWVKSDAPNILMFTDDAGTDFTVDVTAV